MWELAQAIGGQLRTMGDRVIGLDFGAAFAMADAMGVPRAAVGQLLPGVEAAAVTALNRQIREAGDADD